jgi:hypothetical protein
MLELVQDPYYYELYYATIRLEARGSTLRKEGKPCLR